jgi:acetyltransferase-like isoleucine patch superfamily enzyme
MGMLATRCRAVFNRWRRRWVHGRQFRVVFGEISQGRLLPHTRISPSTCIDHEDRLALADHVYIGPHNVIEASAGIVIEEGVQITSHCSIVSHSSHRAMRLLGRGFVAWASPAPQPGWVSGRIVIGAYSFIGPHSLIEAGSRLGRGTIVRAGSVVRGHFDDFAVLAGNPARVVGDSRAGDAAWLQRHPALQAGYDAWVQAPSAVSEDDRP